MNAPPLIRSTSLRDKVSDDEWNLRVNLALCYRLMHKFGFSDMIYNHITARVPDEPHQFLINAYGLHYSEITASSLYKIDHDGEVVLRPDTPYGINYPGFVIHSAVHAARPDVNTVIHTHTRAGVAVSSMKCGLLPLSLSAIRFTGSVGYHDFEGTLVDLGERERLARDLGDNEVLILRNHGLVTCGRSIPETFNAQYLLELSCQIQVDTMAAGTEIVMPSKEVQERTAHQFKPEVRRPYGVMEWEALTRMIEREDPSYKE
jgi:ribulose-5-phosphate 4-epimerase/fuculose-1-phosphate aldolase